MGQLEDDASFIVRSKHRRKVVRHLARGPAIPAQIREETGQEYSRISKAISDLRSEGLVELIVSENTKRGRLYEITDRGRETWEYMVESDMIDE